jgi:class 3 adenylate cyclase
VNAVLVTRRPDGPGKEYPIAGEAVSIGRGEDNDIVLESPGASRYHARIEWTDRGHVVEDRNSKNGTWVNDSRVHDRVPLTDGDILRFGDAEYWFRMQTDATMTITLPTPRDRERELVTIMFTDMQGHTELFEQIGDGAVVKHLDEYLGMMSDEVTRHRGRTIKNLGDGVIASFFSVHDAVDCAIAIQKAVEAKAAEAVGKQGSVSTPIRIGINSGEAIKQAEDVFGLAVVKASRIMSLAHGGEIYLSEVTKTLLGASTDHRVLPKGWHTLKGIERKERLFEVVWK